MNSLLPRSLRLLVFLIPALVVSTGCDDASAAEQQYAEYLDAHAEAYCEGLYECGPPSATGRSLWQPTAAIPYPERNYYASRSDCVRTVRAGVRATLTPTLREALGSGTTLFDADAARSCLETLRGLGPSRCYDWFGHFPVCERVLVGQRPDGAACRTSEECSSLSRCDATASGCRACARHLPDPAQLGEPCGLGGRACDDGLVCAITGPLLSDLTCEPAPVRTVASEGEPCGTAAAVDAPLCDRGLFCRHDPDSIVGTCTAPLPIGATCHRDALDVCVVGSDCIAPGVFEPGVCTPVTVSRHPGDACDPTAWSVRTCSLAANLDCDASTSRCVSPAPGNENAGCEGDWDCTPPYHCEAARCLPPRPEGWACKSDETCASAVCEIAPGEIEGVCGPSRAVPFCQ